MNRELFHDSPEDSRHERRIDWASAASDHDPWRERPLLRFIARARVVFVVSWACVLAACAGPGPVKKVDIESFLEGAEKRAYLVKQFRAEFTKTRHSSMFDRDLTVRGALLFQKPNRFQLKLSGDVNVEILSDGETIRLIHDQTHEESYRVQGERDSSRFADPLMVLLQSVGNGGLRNFRVVRNVRPDSSVILEVEPKDQATLERIQRVTLWLTDKGDIGRVTILFRDGDRDDTVFTSWAAVGEDGPEIRELHQKLRSLTESASADSPLQGSHERSGELDRMASSHKAADTPTANPRARAQ